MVQILETVRETDGPASARRGSSEEISLSADVSFLAFLEHAEDGGGQRRDRTNDTRGRTLLSVVASSRTVCIS